VDLAARRYLLLPPAGGTPGTLRELLDTAPHDRVRCVAYPGRADRIADPAPDTFEELVARVADEAADWCRSTVVVGFSMGGLVGLELTHLLSPAALVVVGTVAPQRRVRRYPLDRDALRELVRGAGLVGGAPSPVDAEVLAYAIELVSGDLRLVAGYRGPAFAAAPCPVVALCGRHDRFVGAVADATAAWRRWATGPFVTETVPGGHLGLLEKGRGPEFWSRISRAEDAIARAEVHR
jgi:surfactin synthase thioesterase subunit